MIRKLFLGLIAGLILVGSITGLAASQVSSSFALDWTALPGGHGRQSSSSFVIDAMLGQTAPGISQTSTTDGPLQLYAGFYSVELPDNMNLELNFSTFLPLVIR